MEATAAGGHRYTLAPWDERLLVRSFVVYGAEEAAATVRPPAALPSSPRPEAPAVPRGAAPPPASASSAWGPLAALPPGVRYLLAGAAPALLLGWFFPFRVMGEGMSFLVHELGHTVAAWLVGRFALPAVVLTISFGQSKAAAVLIWGLIAFAAYRFRRAPRVGVGLVAAALLYPLVAFTRLETDLFSAGGHLLEAIASAFFLRRALVGGFFKDAERPLWAFFGTYLLARNAWLFFRVATDAAARTDYLTVAISGENDLVTLAHAWHVPLEAAAAFTLLVVLAVPLATLALAWRRTRGAS